MNESDFISRQEEFLASTCDKKIKEYKRKKLVAYTFLRGSQMALLVLSALTTYFIATQNEWELISAVFTTIFTAILSTFKFQEDWIRSSKALMELEAERSAYMTKDVKRYLTGVCATEIKSNQESERGLALFTDRINKVIRKEYQDFISTTEKTLEDGK